MRGTAAQEKEGEGAAYGPASGMRRTTGPRRGAAPAATASTARQAPAGTIQRTRCGAAEPSVNAPTRMPIAQPRAARNHPAASFIPGGYTPARAAPVRNRHAIAGVGPPDAATPMVATAASAALPATRRRVDHMSESVSTALTSAPATKPSCTELVRAAVPVDESPPRRARAGATADA